MIMIIPNSSSIGSQNKKNIIEIVKLIKYTRAYKTWKEAITNYKLYVPGI